MGSERGVCFGPNLGSVDYLDLFREPDQWVDLRPQLTAFKMYGDNVRANAAGQFGAGANTYAAMCDAGVFRTLDAWSLPVHLETGAIKDWDPEGTALTADVRALLQRIRSAGGDVDIVSMDEPLASTIRGAFPRAPKQLAIEHAGDTARFAASWARAVRAQGPRVALIESYPYHPATLVEAFVRDIVQVNGVPLAFFELDIDVYGIGDQKLKPQQVASDLARFRRMCDECQMALRVIVTSLRATSDATYRADTLDFERRIEGVAPRFDGATVQSWREFPDNSNQRLIPANLPASNPTSHLAVLREVLASRLLACATV